MAHHRGSSRVWLSIMTWALALLIGLCLSLVAPAAHAQADLSAAGARLAQLYDAKKYQEVIALGRSIADPFKRRYGESSSQYGWLLGVMGVASSSLDRHSDAVLLLRQALA